MTRAVTPPEVVRQFNECINRRDLAGLVALMTDDHTFIDVSNASVDGKAACTDAWRGFFQAFPDYRNTFTDLRADGDRVTVIGFSSCAVPELDGPALWRALVRDGQVAEWRVFQDTPLVRARLNLLPA